MRHRHEWTERAGGRYLEPDHYDGAGWPYEREYATWDCACGDVTRRPSDHDPNRQDRFWRRWLWLIGFAWVCNAAYLLATGESSMWLYVPAVVISVPWFIVAFMLVTVFPVMWAYERFSDLRNPRGER